MASAVANLTNIVGSIAKQNEVIGLSVNEKWKSMDPQVALPISFDAERAAGLTRLAQAFAPGYESLTAGVQASNWPATFVQYADRYSVGVGMGFKTAPIKFRKKGCDQSIISCEHKVIYQDASLAETR